MFRYHIDIIFNGFYEKYVFSVQTHAENVTTARGLIFFTKLDSPSLIQKFYPSALASYVLVFNLNELRACLPAARGCEFKTLHQKVIGLL